MGSISNSLSSLVNPITTSGSSSNTSSSSSSNATGIFTGTSAYSQDFQNVINRAVAIASLPINLLTNQQTALTNQSNELGTLDTLFNTLQTAVQGIDSAMSGSSFQADYSNANVASATLGDGAAEGVYSIGGSGIGAYAATLSANTWNAAPASGGGGSPYTLVVGAQEYTFTPADNSAQTVASTINAQYGNLVHATAVNVGSAAAPDYRISLQSTTLGPMNLDLVQIPSGATANSVLASPSTTWSDTPDAAGSRSMYTLVVGSSTYQFTPADNTAATVASTINAQFGSLVQATVAGTPGQPGYGVSLSSTAQGSSPSLDLQKATAVSYQNVQNPQTTGALAVYTIDGGPPVTSNSRSVTVSNGVTLNLEGTGTTDVTVTRSTSALSTALSSFADAYNAVVDELAKQRGQSAGPLQGQSILAILSQTLSNISTYNDASGQINGLASLGLSFDPSNNGHLEFNALTLMGTDFSNSAGVASFLGSAIGSGFLKAATDALNSLEDPTAGLLKTAESDLTTQITNIGNQITTKQNQVDQLQTTLTSQMAAADALIASMEQQYSYLSNMFQAQQTADQMYK
jgi:flagellar hook-associated protein 2